MAKRINQETTSKNVDTRNLEKAQKVQDFAKEHKSQIEGEQKIDISKDPILDMRTFMKMAEDSGYTLLKKEDLNNIIESQIEKQINAGLLKHRDELTTQTKTKVVHIATDADLDFYQKVLNQPRVDVPVLIQRNSEGESTEHKRPMIDKKTNTYVKTRNNQVILENYIPVSINGFDFNVSLGADLGKGTTPVVIAKNVPLSVAMIIAESRKQTFSLPSGEQYIPYSLVGMEQAPLKPMGDSNTITQSDYIPEKYRG